MAAIKTRSDAHYPSDAVLIEWAKDISYDRLAKKCGVARESLRDYLNIRPELKVEIEAVKLQRLSSEQIKANADRARVTWRKTHPEKVRAINRKWAKNQSKEQRAYWNKYNAYRRRSKVSDKPNAEALEYAATIKGEPCTYFWLCGNTANTVDHIVAVENGGTNSWDNYAALCWGCNSSKGKTDVLQFMLRRM